MSKLKVRDKLTFSQKFSHVINAKKPFDATRQTLNDMCAYLTSLSEEEQLCQKAFILKTIATHWRINEHKALDLPLDLNVELFHYNLYLGP